MDRVLPSNVDYTKILPLAVESRSHRRSFFPTNGQKFQSDGNNIIRVDISAQAFLDPKHSYLRFNFTNNSSITIVFNVGSIDSLEILISLIFLFRFLIFFYSQNLDLNNNYIKLIS